MAETKKKVACRYCKQEVPKGIRRCPYCGTLNPTVTAKEAMKWTIGVIVFIYILGFVLEKVR
jgi:RNA polymerase subunit RPABC4/transcription elongation factor Spt4